MGLLDDLKDDAKLAEMVRSVCSVCKMLKTLPKPEREALLARMNDPEITHASISRVLRANGYNITQGTLARHRNKGCQGGA
jgi:hypothetical protein